MLKTQPRHVLVVGESLVDVVASSAIPPVEAPGGSPLNVAVTLGRLGTSVSILTALGQDARGAALRGHLRRSRVDIRPEAVIPRTSTAVARVGDDGAATYEFDIEWPSVGSCDLGGADIVHTGSIAFFCAPGAADVKRLLQAAHASGARTTLDPNIRPGLVGDHTAAVDHFEASLQWVDVVKLSDEDAKWLYPDLGVRDVMELLLDRGPGLVAITEGSSGASLHTRTARVHVPSITTTVVDTVGAGDAWMGALIHGLSTAPEPKRQAERLDTSDLRALGELANRVAAATVATQGANPPWAEELNRHSPVPEELTHTPV